MLILSRSINEGVVINDGIQVSVEEILAESVRFLIKRNIGGVENREAFILRKGHLYAVNQEITISVVDIKRIGDRLKVRIGIEAPRDARVHRNEVHDALIANAARQIESSNPAPQIAVAFGAKFSQADVENCLEYLSLVYRLKGGEGLKVVGSETVAPELSEVPNGL